MTINFQGSTKITFGEPDEGSNSSSFYQGVGTNQIKWGNVTNPLFMKNNKITFSDSPVPFGVEVGEDFTLGRLSTWNSEINDGTGIDSVPMVVELNLDGPVDTTQTFEFDLDLSSTRNANANGQWGGVYFLPQTGTNETFEYDGQMYSIGLVGFTQPTGESKISELGNRFYTSYERSKTDASVELMAEINEIPKPEPEPIAEEVEVGVINEDVYRKTDNIGLIENNSRNVIDTYKFEVSKESEVNINLDQLRQNANLEIVESDTNTILFQSTQNGTRRETINEVLEKGEYLARVYTDAQEKTTYRIGLKAEEITEEKDNIDTAKNLGILGPQKITELDKIGFGRGISRDKQDYYKFSLDAKSDIFLTLDQLKRNADLEILDNDGRTLLFKSDKGDKKPEKIKEILDEGDYYIKVTPKGSAKTDYQLSLSAEKILNQEDDIKPGIDIGIITPINEIEQQGSIGRGQGSRRDTNDYYNFTVTSENLVTVNLDNLKSNANIEIYTSDDEIIWRGEEMGRRKEEFTELLEPGNYTVRVFPQGNARTDYRLGITAQWPYVDDYNNADEALDFGVVNDDEKKFSNSVGQNYRSESGRDTEDWFRFELSEESDLNIKLSQLRGNLDLVLYDDDGTTLLDDSKKKGRQQEKINQTLEPGEYYVQVKPKGGGRSSYQLTVNAESVEDKPDIFNMGDLSVLETYSNNDRIGFTQRNVRNEIDRYFFNLSGEGRVDVTLDQLRANANLRVLDSRGSLMFDSRNPGRETEEVGEELDAGDYVIEVFPQNAAKTSYNLSVDFVGVLGEVDDNLPGEVIGELTQEYVRESEIGFSDGEDYRDQNDYYTFTLSEDTRVEIDLDNLRANANMELLDSSGSLITRSKKKGKQSESITEELEAGDYRVRVYPQGSAKTDYTLTVLPGTIEEDLDNIPPGEDIGVLGNYNEEDRIGFTENGTRDRADYRKFTLEEDSKFRLNLTNLKQNADVVLYDIDGTLIKRSGKLGKNNEKIRLDLEAGDYYVGVLPKGSARTPYDLNMIAIPPIIDGPRIIKLGTLDSASDPLTAGGVLISSRNSEATYTFDLAQSDFLTVTLDDLKANANLELYASNGKEVLGSSSNSGTSPEEIEVFLEPDTYLVKVLGQGQATSFDLSVGFG